MKTQWLFVLAALIGLAPEFVPGSARATTYTVLVGAEDTIVGATVNAYFPDTLTIHVGDTVHWNRNANEIHTVTFLAGTPLPPFRRPSACRFTVAGDEKPDGCQHHGPCRWAIRRHYLCELRHPWARSVSAPVVRSDFYDARNL